MHLSLPVFTAVALLFLPCSYVNAQLDLQHPLGSELDASNSCHIAVSITIGKCRLWVYLLTQSQCTALVGELVSGVFHGAIPNDFAQQYHFAQAQEVVPACVIQPNSAEDVSKALRIITRHDCPFAIKSGGHSFTGASNIYQGIVLDLRYLNQIRLSEDRSSAFIGPGNRWHEVYEVLAPMNLTVSGGRDNRVGVGGFVLGGKFSFSWMVLKNGFLSTDILVGGISFIARRSGWAADTVKSYEVSFQ
jgi:FAD/FMN-containing dehydrogenase